MPRRAEPAGAGGLYDPGAAARRGRHRHRAPDWRAHPRRHRRALYRCAAYRAGDRTASPGAADGRPCRPVDHGAVRAVAVGARRQCVARGAVALTSQRRAGALHLALCRRIGCCRSGVIRARHRRLRGARHHRLDLGRHRRCLHPAHRLRPAAAALRGEVPPRQAAVACAGARQHFRPRLAGAVDRGHARLGTRAAHRRGADPSFAAHRDREQYRNRRARLLFPRHRIRRPRSLQGQGAGGRTGRQARRRADAARTDRGAQGRSGREDRGRARFALGAGRRPRPDLYRRRAAGLDHRRGRMVAQGLCRAAAGIVRRRSRQGTWG